MDLPFLRILINDVSAVKVVYTRMREFAAETWFEFPEVSYKVLGESYDLSLVATDSGRILFIGKFSIKKKFCLQ